MLLKEERTQAMSCSGHNLEIHDITAVESNTIQINLILNAAR